MQAQLRLARAGVRSAAPIQKRLLATPPVTGLPPAPPPSGALPVRPVVVTATTIPPPTPGSSSLPPLPPPTLGSSGLPPPPPPPPPRPPRRFFRRFLIYTAVGVLTFYPLSGYLSTQSETYRDFFTNTVPGGETVADYADDQHWENFGFGTVSKKAVQGWQSVTGDGDKPKDKVADAKQTISRQVDKAVNKVEKVTGREEKKAASTLSDLKAKALSTAQEASDKTKALASEASTRAQELASQAKEKVGEATDKVPFNFSEGVEGIVKQAEDALHKAEGGAKDAYNKAAGNAGDALHRAEGGAKDVLHRAESGAKDALGKAERGAKQALHKVEDEATRAEKAVAPQPTGPRSLPDTQRPRELRPETVNHKSDPTVGKERYSGPPLPLGFEPPPGFYLAKPKVEPLPVEGAPLPLLAPKVKDFASEEPIIAQLASTIDSLTSSLSHANAGSSNATGILTKAHDDLSALSSRLSSVKKAEKEKLEKTIAEKTKEFEGLLKAKTEEAKKGEQGLKAGWDQERQKMVDTWRTELEGELETQRTGIDKRLREEVVSQGIELQRRWLRSIKTQVETERGGRLAKLDQLTTSLKHLERITLDNSATLDQNVRVNKVWSALRALQTKAELGDVAFDHELRVLKSLTTSDEEKTVISPALQQLEASGVATTGIKSFASLSSWFTSSVAPRIHSASLTPTPEESTVVSHLASIALSKIMFRPTAGAVEGNDVGSVLARAEWCLGEKDLDGAAREINGLKGWPGKLAGDWLREARRNLEVKQALEVVATEATLESLLLS